MENSSDLLDMKMVISFRIFVICSAVIDSHMQNNEKYKDIEITIL